MGRDPPFSDSGKTKKVFPKFQKDKEEKSQTDTFLLLLKQTVLTEVSLHISSGHSSRRGTGRGWWGRLRLGFRGRSRGTNHRNFFFLFFFFITIQIFFVKFNLTFGRGNWNFDRGRSRGKGRVLKIKCTHPCNLQRFPWEVNF